MEEKPRRINTVEKNLDMWSQWDWSKCGEEWSSSPEWKLSLVDHVLRPRVPANSRILEIGPGGGRWTEFLIPLASRLTLVDLTPQCIEVCRERFKEFSHIDYHVNDGRDLGFLGDASIDCLWSFDVFVHVAPDDVRAYMGQFARILAPGARGILHHAKSGRNDLGWRSDMTAERMREFCAETGFGVVEQFDSWDDDRVHIWPGLPPHQGPDIITVFEKPR